MDKRIIYQYKIFTTEILEIFSIMLITIGILDSSYFNIIIGALGYIVFSGLNLMLIKKLTNKGYDVVPFVVSFLSNKTQDKLMKII